MNTTAGKIACIEAVFMPEDWYEFTRCPPPSLAPGEWPRDIYAGRLTMWGHRVATLHLPECSK